MNEKNQANPLVHSPLPPSYDCILRTPPPPTYLQSTTRLYYKNQPFISDFEELTFRQEQERQRHLDHASDTWSEIAKLPLRQRLAYYVNSWRGTIDDGRLIFFAFFVFASFTTLAVVIAVVAFPSVLKN